MRFSGIALVGGVALLLIGALHGARPGQVHEQPLGEPPAEARRGGCVRSEADVPEPARSEFADDVDHWGYLMLPLTSLHRFRLQHGMIVHLELPYVP